MSKLGFDLDGVLVDWNSAFIALMIQLTGRDLFPPRPFDIPTWNYPTHYGYTTAEVSYVWTDIKASPYFWQSLKPYETTGDALRAIHDRWRQNDDLYFITSRPGIDAKKQTENWLRMHWPMYTVPPLTVLISSHKGLCAKALHLDAYIDDKDTNVCDVVREHATCRTFLLDRPWNRDLEWPDRIQSVTDMLSQI